MFAAAFIIFALDSYFTSISAGELACNRAYAEDALSGGILGIGAILMIAGLDWLIATYSGPGSPIAEIILYIARGIWTVIIAMLAISGVSVGDAMLTNRRHGFVNTFPWVIGVGIALAVGLFVRHFRGLKDEDTTARWVRVSALSSLGAAICFGLSTGIASALGAGWWHRPDTVYIVVTLSMLVPAVPLVTSVPSVMAARTAAMNGTDPGKKSNEGTVPEILDESGPMHATACQEPDPIRGVDLQLQFQQVLAWLSRRKKGEV